MTRLIRFAVVAAAVAFAASARADDKVENPEFKNWSKFKAGTSVTLKMTTEAGGQTFGATTTNKLIEVKDDKLVMESEMTSTFMGKDNKLPAQKRDIVKTLDKAPTGVDPKTGKPDGTTEEGKEKVKIGGTEYECKWYKFKSKQKLPTGEEEVEGQIWMSDDVPGMVVKMTTKMKSGGMSMEATEITIKK